WADRVKRSLAGVTAGQGPVRQTEDGVRLSAVRILNDLLLACS
ncbi:MAG: hypothetical protein QOF84_7774, partial [Streptomyces sp.]|nr:hypothetical protein [Streptomyces sp.]